MLVLFLKAKAPVQVKGYTRKDGTFVTPHSAMHEKAVQAEISEKWRDKKAGVKYSIVRGGVEMSAIVNPAGVVSFSSGPAHVDVDKEVKEALSAAGLIGPSILKKQAAPADKLSEKSRNLGLRLFGEKKRGKRYIRDIFAEWAGSESVPTEIMYSGSSVAFSKLDRPLFLTHSKDIAGEYAKDVGGNVYGFVVRGKIIDVSRLGEIGIDDDEIDAVDLANSPIVHRAILKHGYSGMSFGGDATPQFTPHDSVVVVDPGAIFPIGKV